jgi:LysM domain
MGGHLTRRGRRLMAFLALVPLVAAMVLTGTHEASATGTLPTSKQIVVHAGESLWDIAVRVAPNADPRKTMWDIQQLNHMSTSRLDSGQALIVPVS